MGHANLLPGLSQGNGDVVSIRVISLASRQAHLPRVRAHVQGPLAQQDPHPPIVSAEQGDQDAGVRVFMVVWGQLIAGEELLQVGLHSLEPHLPRRPAERVDADAHPAVQQRLWVMALPQVGGLLADPGAGPAGVFSHHHTASDAVRDKILQHQVTVLDAGPLLVAGPQRVTVAGPLVVIRQLSSVRNFHLLHNNALLDHEAVRSQRFHGRLGGCAAHSYSGRMGG
mmetsp:Transcript_31978/g.57300  ORF Transcript_31978/g.57300 Transcript_31978/m.57300 type:complete len:226 (+) Transcript_31978:337-1014(+)